MKIILKKSKLPVNVMQISNKSDKPVIFSISADTSRTNGALRFTHEFCILIKIEDKKVSFLGGEEIACENIEYTPDEDGREFFEHVHPGLYDDIKVTLQKKFC